MNKNKKLKLGITGFSLLMMSNVIFAENLFAKEENHHQSKTNLSITEGEFILQTSGLESFGQITLTTDRQTVKTNFNMPIFKVIDARGTQEGWRVIVHSTIFKEVTYEGFIGEPTILPIGSLALEMPKKIEQVGNVHNSKYPILSKGVQILDNGAIVVITTANKGEGMGEFDITFNKSSLQLTIDAATARIDKVNYPDSLTPYASTITWDLISGLFF